jgi:hypothetical protein
MRIDAVGKQITEASNAGNSGLVDSLNKEYSILGQEKTIIFNEAHKLRSTEIANEMSKAGTLSALPGATGVPGEAEAAARAAAEVPAVSPEAIAQEAVKAAEAGS